MKVIWQSGSSVILGFISGIMAMYASARTEPRMLKAVFPILLLLVSGFFVPNARAQNPARKLVMSKEALTSEQIAIDRAVLFHYTKGDPIVLALADRTRPFSREFKENPVCMGDVLLPAPDAIPLVHRMDMAVALSDRMVLVKASRQDGMTAEESNDASQAQAAGRAPENFVMPPNTKGVFTFSEIIFNKDHSRAAVQYEFYCGGLCANGGTAILVIEDGQWKIITLCANWIS